MAAAANATTSTDRPHSLRGGFGTQPLRDYGSLALTLVVGSAASASGVTSTSTAPAPAPAPSIRRSETPGLR